MRTLETALSESLGQRMVSPAEAERYETDYSMFRAKPQAAIRPQSIEDLRVALSIARSFGVPVTARGGGSNTGGSALTKGILLLVDHEAFATVLVDPEKPVVSVGAAARHDIVQRALRDNGLWLPSDPSSGPLSRIGGNIATRASGPHALKHGSIAEYLSHISFMCSDGTHVNTEEPDTIPKRLTESLAQLSREIASDREAIAELRRHSGHKWASGLDLLSLAESGDQPARAIPRLICGSVGSLAVVTSAVLVPQPVPENRVAVQIAFERELDACYAALLLRETAEAVEFMSRESIALLREHTNTLVHTAGEALLIVEFSGSFAEPHNLKASLQAISRDFSLSDEIAVATSQHDIDLIWKARKALLPTIQRVCRETARSAHSVVNDIGVPPARLPELLEGLRTIFSDHDLDVAIYGHAGSGNLHLRPLFGEAQPEELFTLAREVYACATALGGFITAEHGMGPLRTPFLSLEWSPRVLTYMRRVKSIFDPEGLLNPGALLPEERDRGSAWSLSLNL